MKNRHIDPTLLSAFYEKILDEKNQDKNIPCISVTLKKLLALDVESEISTQELAQIILDDYGLISKILQTVNTFYYNRLGHKITTVTQAVILLGFNAVRKIAVSLSIIDILPETGNSSAARIMASAFMASHLATSLKQDESINPEEIFIATLFKPLARLFTAIHDPDFYLYIQSIEDRLRDKPEELEEVKAFWKGLGRKIIDSWHIPDVIATHIEGQPSKTGMETEQELINLSCRIAESFIENKSLQEIVPLIDELENLTGARPSELAAKLEKAVSKTSKNAEAFSVILKDINPVRTLAPVISIEKAAIQDKTDELIFTDEEERFGEYALELTIQMIDVIIARQLSLNQVFMLAVEIMKRGTGLDNIMLCLFDREREALSARFGLGRHADFLRETLFLNSPMENTLIKKAMENNAETKGRWKAVLSDSQDKITNELKDTELCVSPLVIKNKNVGCFFMDKLKGGQFSKLDLKKIEVFRKLIVLAAG